MQHYTMHLLRLLAVLTGIAAASTVCVHAEENVWPFYVAQTDAAERVTSWQAVGPLVFEKPAASGGTVSGFRPFFAEWRNDDDTLRERNFLYPLFIYRVDSERYRWSILQLVNRSGHRADSTAARLPTLTHETFDIWPFWFSRKTGSPESSYRALFPLHGTIKSRFGYEQIDFTLFPFYARTERKGTVATSTPWPFLKITRGAESGFALWPLYGQLEKTDAFERRFYLWPLGWNNTRQLADDDTGEPAGQRREVGFLPFYTRETAPGFINENYLWPFFGYTDRTTPVRYQETRYFWPFLVRGRGDQKTVDRYGPFYTHSNVKGVDKTWVLWPAYREKSWTESDLSHTQRQLFYFIYRSTEQRSAANPAAAPASKTHYWPFLSVWDNGAGREQVQFPSPLEVFFPDNERVRVSWSPLFALYRYDQRAPGATHHEFLWGLVSRRTGPALREFHLGPLFSMKERDGEKRYAIGNGLVAWQRAEPGGRWRFFWFDFPGKANKVRASSR